MLFDIPKALLEAGGWTVATAIAIGVIAALIRGDLVTGRSAKEALDRETTRADRATDQLESSSDIGEKVVAANDRLSGQISVLIDLMSKMLMLRGSP